VANVQTVLRILGNFKRADLRHKDILTRAIIAEHKRHPGPFWTTVLLLAYSPMLGGLRGRILGDAFDREDLDQLVIDTFLSVVTGFPLIEKRSRTFLHLKQFTSQQVFRVIRFRQNEIKQQFERVALAKRLDDFVLFGKIESVETAEDRDEMADFLRNIAIGKEPQDNVALIIDTVIYRKKPTDYVNEQFPSDDPEQQERIYQRIKKQRLRSLKRLRAILQQLFVKSDQTQKNKCGRPSKSRTDQVPKDKAGRSCKVDNRGTMLHTFVSWEAAKHDTICTRQRAPLRRPALRPICNLRKKSEGDLEGSSLFIQLCRTILLCVQFAI
jgi:hypothetical protein